jgi:hypothetical protein
MRRKFKKIFNNFIPENLSKWDDLNRELSNIFLGSITGNL